MWLIVAAAVALLIGLGCATYSFYNFGMLGTVSEKNAAKLAKLSTYDGSPHQKAAARAYKYVNKMPNEDVYIQSFDGLKLHGKIFPCPSGGKNFIIGIHGCRSNALNEFGAFMKFYHENGYNMLLPDDRAHGESQGKYIGFGNLDRFDCIKWAEYVVERYGEDCRIILHGVSMGGAAVLSAAGEKLPEQVKGIISDSAFSSVYEQFSKSFVQIFKLPPFPFVPLCSFMGNFRAGYNFKKDSPLELVKKAKVPILFVQGLADTVVEPEMADKLYDACPTRKRMLKIPDSGHAQSIGVDPVGYKAAIKEFFAI